MEQKPILQQNPNNVARAVHFYDIQIYREGGRNGEILPGREF